MAATAGAVQMFGRDIKMIAISEIERLPSAPPEQQWIPCSEKLPDNGRPKACPLIEIDGERRRG